MANDTHPCDYAYPVAPGDVPYWQPGMTLRDYFAGQALAGVITVCARDTLPPGCTRHEYFADQARQIADAMMKARGDDQ